MAAAPWFRRRPAELEREQVKVLSEWMNREVKPYSAYWADRLRVVGASITSPRSLDVAGTFTEAQMAGAGGVGNPALLLSPTEDQFKKYASRSELLAAARQAGGAGITGRRNAIWYRYKPVHVHEAGVDRLISVAYTRADLDRLHLAGARLAEVLGWGAEDALLNLVASAPSIRFWGLYHAALATRMTAVHPRSGGQGAIDAARRGAAMLPASVMTVPVEEALQTLQGLVAAGTRMPNLRMIAPVGPPPSAAVRVALAQAGGQLSGRNVRVQAIWAPETSRVLYGEAPPTATDPPEATYGLLTYPDLELLHVCDPDYGTTLDDGQAGQLVTTSLGWRGTALVRYATGSWVAGIESGSPHPVNGATVPRIAPALADGAWQPKVRGNRGAVRPDLRQTRRIIEPVAQQLGVANWSLRESGGQLVWAVSGRGQIPQGPLDQAAAKIGAASGVVPTVRVDAVQASARPQIGSAGSVQGR